MSSEQAAVDEAAEIILDLAASLADGKADHELVFFGPVLREIAIQWSCEHLLPDEIAPMTAGELRRRAREGRSALARGDGP